MNWRIVAAFLIAPALCPLAKQLFDRLTLKPEQLDANAFHTTLLLGVCYAMALLAGIPLHDYLRRKAWHELLHYMLAGAVLGLVPAVAASLTASWVPSNSAFSPIWTGLLFGSLSGAAFWFIGMYSRAAKA